MLALSYRMQTDLEAPMKARLLTGVFCLAAATALLALGLVKVSYPIWHGTMTLFPAGFFALLGIVLIFRSLRKLA